MRWVEKHLDDGIEAPLKQYLEAVATIRDIGCWDPLPFPLKRAYDHGGHTAQVEFWSPQPEPSSMLAQLAHLLRPRQ